MHKLFSTERRNLYLQYGIAIFHISLKLEQHYPSYAMNFECEKGALFKIPNEF